MDYNQKIEWLHQYLDVGEVTPVLEEEISRLTGEITRLERLIISDSPGGELQQLRRRRDELAAEVKERAEAGLKVTHALDQVEKMKHRELLYHRYINGLSWREISMRMDMDERWLRRLHKSLIQKFNIPQE